MDYLIEASKDSSDDLRFTVNFSFFLISNYFDFKFFQFQIILLSNYGLHLFRFLVDPPTWLLEIASQFPTICLYILYCMYCLHLTSPCVTLDGFRFEEMFHHPLLKKASKCYLCPLGSLLSIFLLSYVEERPQWPIQSP